MVFEPTDTRLRVALRRWVLGLWQWVERGRNRPTGHNHTDGLHLTRPNPTNLITTQTHPLDCVGGRTMRRSNG